MTDLASAVNKGLAEQVAQLAGLADNVKYFSEVVKAQQSEIAELKSKQEQLPSYAADQKKKKRRWMGTFPRSLTGKQRSEHCEQIVEPKLPHHIRDPVTVTIAWVGNSYGFTFATVLPAKEFSNLLRDHDLSWADPRDGRAREVYPRRDMPIDVRQRQRAANKLHEGGMTLLRNGGKDVTGFRLGAHGYQGPMRYASSDEVFEM
ncbi:unnamed protein product, partial [Prorocentrum cordatum]